MTYIPPSQCESCIPTLALANDGDTVTREHETTCPNRKARPDA